MGAISKILRKIFVVAIKKMLVIQFPYMEIVWLVFYFFRKKNKKSQSFQSKQPKKRLNVLQAVELIVQSFFFHKKKFKKKF